MIATEASKKSPFPLDQYSLGALDKTIGYSWHEKAVDTSCKVGEATDDELNSGTLSRLRNKILVRKIAGLFDDVLHNYQEAVEIEHGATFSFMDRRLCLSAIKHASPNTVISNTWLGY